VGVAKLFESGARSGTALTVPEMDISGNADEQARSQLGDHIWQAM